MVDVTLSYSNINMAPNEQMKATVWVDSELAEPKQQCTIDVSYFTPSGEDLGNERITAVHVPAASATKLSQLQYVPSAKQEGDVVIVRLALLCAAETGAGAAGDA